MRSKKRIFKFSKTKLVKSRDENSKYRKNSIKRTKKASMAELHKY